MVTRAILVELVVVLSGLSVFHYYDTACSGRRRLEPGLLQHNGNSASTVEFNDDDAMKASINPMHCSFYNLFVVELVSHTYSRTDSKIDGEKKARP